MPCVCELQSMHYEVRPETVVSRLGQEQTFRCGYSPRSYTVEPGSQDTSIVVIALKACTDKCEHEGEWTNDKGFGSGRLASKGILEPVLHRHQGRNDCYFNTSKH